ncbi:MAG: tryptophan 7-halogenase [Acidobacteria bacterium]|nr:tryptophan 7-halogenase [Acidobacteriota bacterium]
MAGSSSATRRRWRVFASVRARPEAGADRLFAHSTYDTVVIGAGPAGATAAALVAEGGHRVLLLERDTFPRFKIGESLMPACGEVLGRLGLVDRLQTSHFPKKFSVQFFSPSGQASSPFYFSEVECARHPQTWQVLRSEFDQLMADNARAKGAEVHHGVSVRDVLFEGDRAVGVRGRGPGGEAWEVGARVVVDATGQNALLARKLDLQEDDPNLRNASIFTHFAGGVRDPGRDEGATLILHTTHQRSWFWSIPLPDDRVSIGLVAPQDYLVRPPKRPPQQVFEEELAQCPGLLPRLEGARQVMPVQVLRDFTYKARRRAGDGWVLVGDAYGFVDPLYSSGVLLALKSGELAADAICQGLSDGDLSGDRLGAFEGSFLRGMEAIRKLVYAFYDPDFSFARFLKRHPQYKDALVRILIGDVFRDDVDDLFVPMAEMVELPEAWT